MVSSFSVKSNDYMYVIYVSSLIRSVLSLHDLINNRIAAKDIEIEKAKILKDEEDEKKKKEEEMRKKVEEKKNSEEKKSEAEL
jgi:26S proteasome regulatory subunit N8